MLAATQMALDDSQFSVKAGEEYRVGVIAATAIGSCKTFEANHEFITKGLMRNVTPYLVINLSANTAGGEMAFMCGARGPHHARNALLTEEPLGRSGLSLACGERGRRVAAVHSSRSCLRQARSLGGPDSNFRRGAYLR